MKSRYDNATHDDYERISEIAQAVLALAALMPEARRDPGLLAAGLIAAAGAIMGHAHAPRADIARMAEQWIGWGMEGAAIAQAEARGGRLDA